MIPKVIHFCWFGGNEYTPLVVKCMKTWSEYLPDWDFVLWNESNSPVSHPFVKKALKDKKYAFAADYVRFYALYNYGGIYLDTDIEVLKDLDFLLHNSFFSGYESNDMQFISAGILGSIAKHPYLEDVIKYYNTLKVYETSPHILTKIFNNSKYDGVKIYEKDYFYPYNPFDDSQKVKQLFFSDLNEKTCAIHHWNYSWNLSFLDRIIKYIRKFV